MESKQNEGTGHHEFTASEEEKKKTHKFWDTQPVPRMAQLITKTQQIQQGAIDPPKTANEVREAPLKLPAALEWVDVDLADDEWAAEVYRLLAENYVEDDDSIFRFDYSVPFLRWALMPPHCKPEWHLGVSVAGKKRLVGFISAIPATVNVYGQSLPMVEINFLCVYKPYREKRLAPVLIKEITRRANRNEV